MSAADLLPARLTSHWTRALAAGMSDDLPVPIREAVDPAATPAALLPWLAVHDGVRLWFSDWSEEKKRRVVAEGLVAAFEVGTRAGAIRFLGYVDATLVDAVAYPARWIMGRAIIGRTPIGHPPFLARYLVKVETSIPKSTFVMGRSFLGRCYFRKPDRTPFDRCLAALRAAKAPETEIRVDFAHRRRLTLGDAPRLDGSHKLGDFVDRTKL